MGKKSFFEELKKRNLYKVAIVYAITGWVMVQVAAIATDAFAAPPWVLKVIILILLLGFPVALIFVWAFEVTPEGIKRQKDVDESKSIAHHTAKKLNYWIIGLLSSVVIFLVVDKVWLKTESVVTQVSAASAAPSVAVLPFDDFSKKGDQQWFANGLTEELLNSLARLEGLKVAARTSSFQFKDTNIPIVEIADSLGVRYVVEGSVRRAGNDMRITAQLIRAEDGFHLWSKTYKRKVKDVFKVQKDIAENIAAALNIYLDEEARNKMFRFGTRSVDAYEAYLKGRGHYDDLHFGSNSEKELGHELFVQAEPWFKKAIELDPDFAAPYYYMADPYTHYLMNYPAGKLDTLSRQEAKNRILHYFDQAINYTEDQALKFMYKLERTFLSDNWSRLPHLIQKLKTNPDVIRPYTMINGGWTTSFLASIGHAKLQYKLNSKALKRDPLDRNLQGTRLKALSQFANYDRVIAAANSYASNYPVNLNNQKFFLNLKASRFKKADSLAWIMTTSPTDTISRPIHPLNIMLQAARGNVEQARKNFKNFPNKKIKNTLNGAIIHYAVGNIKKANKIAAKADSSAFGPQKLLLTANNFFGILPFQLKATPNLARLLKQAGVEVEMRPFGNIAFPTIVQKDV